MNFWTTYRLATRDTTRGWLNSRVATGKGKNTYFLEIPAFEFTQVPELGASFIVTEFHTTVGASFVIPRIPLVPPTPLEFCLAVRFPRSNSDGLDVTRYKLWEDVGEELYFPLYNGEVIPSNCVFEIWTLENADSVELALPFRIYLGLLAQPTTARVCCESDSAFQFDPTQVCELFVNGELIVPTEEEVGILTEDEDPITDEESSRLITEDTDPTTGDVTYVGDYALPLVPAYCLNEGPGVEDVTEVGIITEDLDSKLVTEITEIPIVTEEQADEN
jgi:hypothetical protein